MGKLIDIMSEKLSMKKEDITDGTAYNNAPNWDSITHLEITNALEQAFNVEFDVDEVTAMQDVAAIKAILKKHGVTDL